MSLKKSTLQALSAVTTVGLALGVAAPANALLSDNVHNAAGGGVNIHADNTCVEKSGTPLISSSWRSINLCYGRPIMDKPQHMAHSPYPAR